MSKSKITTEPPMRYDMHASLVKWDGEVGKYWINKSTHTDTEVCYLFIHLNRINVSLQYILIKKIINVFMHII